MRVQQILLARLNDTLKPFDLTFPRYEALMLLYYSPAGSAAAGQDGRPPAGPPHERDQHHRRAGALGLVTREPHERDRRTTLAAITPQGRETAEAVTPILNEMRFGTAPLGGPSSARSRGSSSGCGPMPTASRR